MKLKWNGLIHGALEGLNRFEVHITAVVFNTHNILGAIYYKLYSQNTIDLLRFTQQCFSFIRNL